MELGGQTLACPRGGAQATGKASLLWTTSDPSGFLLHRKATAPGLLRQPRQASLVQDKDVVYWVLGARSSAENSPDPHNYRA